MEWSRLRLGLVATIACAALVAAGTAASSIRQHPLLTVSPPVVHLKQPASVAIRGLAGQGPVEVRLQGAAAPSGTLLPWVSLRLENGVWRGSLPEPALSGMYPIEVRTAGAATVTDGRWFLRVFPVGTLSRPSFAQPVEVASWWVRAVARATLTAIRPWHLLADDHRDPQLHRLFVVAYSPPGDASPSDRKGIWITTVRDGYHGRWRLLEATVLP